MTNSATTPSNKEAALGPVVSKVALAVSVVKLVASVISLVISLVACLVVDTNNMALKKAMIFVKTLIYHSRMLPLVSPWQLIFNVMKNVIIVMVLAVNQVLRLIPALTVMALVKRLLFKIHHLVVCNQPVLVLVAMVLVRLSKNHVLNVVDPVKS